MKFVEIKAVHTAVRINLELFISSKGEAPLTNLDGFTVKMFNLFDAHYEHEVRVLNRK